MSLIQRVPRTSQPQGAVGIDWSNPLTRGLTLSLPLSAGSGYASLGTDKRVATINGPVTKGVTSKGTAAKFNGTGYIDLGSAALISDTTPVTITLYEEQDTVSAYSTLLSLVAGSIAWTWLRGTSEGYYCSFGPTSGGLNTRNFNSLGAPVAGEKVRFIITCPNGLGSYAGLRCWANGVELTSVTTNYGSAAASTNKIGWDGVDNKVNARISDVNLIGRVWLDTEIQAYFDNPYQLFTSIQRRILVASIGGGTSYTLIGDATAQAASSGAGVITQAHALAGAGTAQEATSGSGAITQVHALAGGSTTQAATSGTSTIMQEQILLGVATSQSATSGAGTISSSAAVVTQGALNSDSLNAFELNSDGPGLAGASSSQTATSSTGAITQSQILIGATTGQVAVSGSVVITQAHALAGAASFQNNATTAWAISQVHQLLVAACSQAALSSTGPVTFWSREASMFRAYVPLAANAAYVPLAVNSAHIALAANVTYVPLAANHANV